MRIHEPREKLEGFRGHRGTCVHCKKPVFMLRMQEVPFTIKPDNCYCIGCGQRYFVETNLSLQEFEYLQWKQKEAGDIGWTASEDMDNG